jgi:hypothetical protein
LYFFVQGHSGDAVSLIIDTSLKKPKMVAVVKVFSKSKTFESELAALTRMHLWLSGSTLVSVPEALVNYQTLQIYQICFIYISMIYVAYDHIYC